MLFEEELGEAGAADAEAWGRLEGVGRSLVNLLPMFGVGGIVGEALKWGSRLEQVRQMAGTGELLLALAVERKELAAEAARLMAVGGSYSAETWEFLQRVRDGGRK